MAITTHIDTRTINRVSLSGITTSLSPLFFLIRFTSKVNCNLNFVGLFANIDEDCDVNLFDLEEVAPGNVDAVNGKVNFSLFGDWDVEIWGQTSSTNLDPNLADEVLVKIGLRIFSVNVCCDVNATNNVVFVTGQIVGDGAGGFTVSGNIGNITVINNSGTLELTHDNIAGFGVQTTPNIEEVFYSPTVISATRTDIVPFNLLANDSNFFFLKIGLS